MLIRVSSMLVRICGVLALLLGLYFWITGLPDVNGPIAGIHELLGILTMVGLWILSYKILTAPKGKNVGLAIGGFVLGLIAIFVGLTQANALYLGASTHWIIQVVHLLIGLAAIGLGEAITGRYRRLNKANA